MQVFRRLVHTVSRELAHAEVLHCPVAQRQLVMPNAQAQRDSKLMTEYLQSLARYKQERCIVHMPWRGPAAFTNQPEQFHKLEEAIRAMHTVRYKW